MEQRNDDNLTQRVLSNKNSLISIVQFGGTRIFSVILILALADTQASFHNVKFTIYLHGPARGS